MSTCDFGPDPKFPGYEPCEEDDVKVVRLRVAGSEQDILLELCGRHRLAIFDAALTREEGTQ